jgi:hypothetical protein
MRAIAVLVAAVVVASCAEKDHYPSDHFTSGFGPQWKAGPEFDLRGFLRRWHVPREEVDCFVATAMQKATVGDEGWTADELNSYATVCDVDVSEMWQERTD